MGSHIRAVLILVSLNGLPFSSLADTEAVNLAAADQAYDNFEMDAAIVLYSEAIASGRFSGQALAVIHIKRGVAYAFLDDHETALVDFNSAIDNDPKNPWALYNRARTLAQLEIYGRALADADAVIELRPDVAESYIARAHIYQQLAKFGLALADLDVADQLKSGNRAVYIARGYTLSLMGDHERAVYEYEMAGLLSGGSVRSDADEGLGISKLALGKFSDAANDFSGRLRRPKSLAYWSLWLHVARSRAGKNDVAELKRLAAEDLEPDAWPAPIVQYFDHGLKPEKLRAIAAVGDDAEKRLKQCSAEFFIAQRELIDGHKKAAKPIFEKVLSICDLGRYERIVAQAELKRLSAR
jgi:lipoprotein NlpI